MIKTIIPKEDMLTHIKSAMDKITTIVGRTLGPGGLPIIIERDGQSINGEPLPPISTKDGVTAARACFSSIPEENAIIQVAKHICSQTNQVAGDGTTTALVLGRALLFEALKLIDEEKLNPQVVRRSLELAVDETLQLLTKESVECKSLDMIEHVATISANGDKSIGNTIRNAFEAVGTDGIITVDEGGAKNHTLEIVDGFQIQRGAEAQDRFFNNQERTKFEAENVHVALYDGKLTQPAIVIEVLKTIYERSGGKMPPVLFLANEFSMDVLQIMLMNKAEAGLSICAVRNPHQTKVTTAMLDDMAVFMGGERLGNGNRNLNNLEFDDIGIANKVIVDKYSATFFGGQGTEDAVLERIEQLKSQRESAESHYDAALISDRIASLAEGIAKIGVGGSTDLEVKEKYHRIEDAVNAVRAAISEGVIPGGGATLLRIAAKLDADTIGRRILKTALEAPFNQILANLGIDSYTHDSIANKLKTQAGTTFDGESHTITDALTAGIIDPVKVTKAALQNASSVTSLLATTGGAIVNHPFKIPG